MPTLRVSREEARRAITRRVIAGQELVGALADRAESTGRYADWRTLFEKWRVDTAAVLDGLYEETDVGREFSNVTSGADHSAPRYTFPHRKNTADTGVYWLKRLDEGLPLAMTPEPDATAMASVHPEILAKCGDLFDRGHYAEAVEKGFKVVRDRLRRLTGHETGQHAFGSDGRLYVEGAAAPPVDEDFQKGVQFLTMSIDRFRNEKSHTADGNIREPVRAYEYLRLSSLAMHLLDAARQMPAP